MTPCVFPADVDPDQTIDVSTDAAAATGGAPTAGRSMRFPWHLLVLVVILIAPFVSILLTPQGRILGHPQCDNPQAYYYINHFAGECWRNGIIPLWNPHVMLGIPFVGEGEAAVFHPLSALFAFLRTGLAINWLVVISFVATGVFMYGYLRALELGRSASWCGAASLCFSSLLISRVYAGHLNILLSLISMPLILMFWERYRSQGGVRNLAGIALAYGAMILAFYPLVLYIFSLFFLLYVLMQSVMEIRSRTELRAETGKVARLGAFIGIGIAIGAIQLLPSVDFLTRSFRAKSSIEFCGMFSYPPENLLTAVVPAFFGSDPDPASAHRYWGRCFFWEMWLYIGVLPLIMAIAGAAVGPRRRCLPLLLCAGVFLLIGFGKNTPFFPLLYEHVPFFDAFRGSSKYTIVTLFCLVTLSAIGFDALLSAGGAARARFVRRIGLLCSAAIIGLAVAGYLALIRGAEQPGSNWEQVVKWFGSRSAGDRYSPIDLSAGALQSAAANAGAGLIRAAVLAALTAGILGVSAIHKSPRLLFPAAAVLILADLAGTFRPMMKTFDRTITRFPKEFADLIEGYPNPYPPRILNLENPWPNMAIVHDYSSVYGYTGNTLRRYNDFLNRIQGQPIENSMATQLTRSHTSHFRMLAIDAAVIDTEHLPAGQQAIGLFGNKALVPYEKFPRVYLAASPRSFKTREDALAYTLSGEGDVLVSPAIEHDQIAVEAKPLEANESASILSFAPTRVELEARANHPRILVLCEMFSRHWKARINGEAAEVMPANSVFRAVQVPAGISRIVMEYRPWPFYLGTAVTTLALSLLFAIIGIARARQRVPLPSMPVSMEEPAAS